MVTCDIDLWQEHTGFVLYDNKLFNQTFFTDITVTDDDQYNRDVTQWLMQWADYHAIDLYDLSETSWKQPAETVPKLQQMSHLRTGHDWATEH